MNEDQGSKSDQPAEQDQLEVAGGGFSADWDVPAFDETLFKVRGTKYVIVIPVIDEGDRILGQLRTMQDVGLMAAYDVVIVDGGSTDGSTEPEKLASFDVAALLVKTAEGRLSTQLRIGYAWSLARGYAGIITIDGNGKDSVDSVPLFAKALDKGVGYAQASRYLSGGEGRNTPKVRDMAIRMIHAPVVSIASGTKLTDTTQGFRAYSSEFLSDPRVKPFRDMFVRYELLAYLSVRAGKLGYKVVEIPTVRIYPEAGRVPTKISGFSGQLQILGVLFKAASGFYNPPRD